jgi:alkylhydroperoxidase family enzyme
MTSAQAWPVFAAADVRALAPAAIASFDVVFGAVDTSVDGDRLELVRRRVTALLTPSVNADPLPDSLPAAELTCLEFAEQFVLDVSAISASDRQVLASTLGAATFGFVQALYVIDHGLRLRCAVAQLFGTEVFTEAPSDAGLWPALEAMMTAVVVLDTLDPLTSELIRLRGAQAHNCRVCRSRRMVSVVAAHGASVLEQVEDYEHSTLSEPAKVALRFTDAILWDCGAIPGGVLDDVRAMFSPAAALEIVLDVVRNASNKIAVALGADQASVTDGVEYFDVSADGGYQYGLEAPATR